MDEDNTTAGVILPGGDLLVPIECGPPRNTHRWLAPLTEPCELYPDGLSGLVATFDGHGQATCYLVDRLLEHGHLTGYVLTRRLRRSAINECVSYVIDAATLRCDCADALWRAHKPGHRCKHARVIAELPAVQQHARRFGIVETDRPFRPGRDDE